MHLRYCLYLFTFCGIVSLISCETTSIVPIRVYDPAKVKFPDSARCFTLVNRLNFPIGKESNDKKSEIDSFALNNIAQKKLFEGVEDVLYSSELIDTVTIVQKTREDKNALNFDIELESMNWDTIRAISTRNRSDIVISLDRLNITHVYSAKSAYTFGADFDALFGKIGNLKIYLSALFRVYDPEKKHLIEKYHYSDTIFWESEGTSLHSAIRNLPSKNDAMSEAAYWSGFYYGEIFPKVGECGQVLFYPRAY